MLNFCNVQVSYLTSYKPHVVRNKKKMEEISVAGGGGHSEH